jgi:hypothetical protein
MLAAAVVEFILVDLVELVVPVEVVMDHQLQAQEVVERQILEVEVVELLVEDHLFQVVAEDLV